MRLSWRTTLLATLLLALVPLLTLSAQARKSATFDEPLNLVHGLRALAHGDLGVPVDYGPLTRVLAALAVRASGVPVSPLVESLPWTLRILPRAAQRILYLESDADRVLFRARLAFLPLHLLLAVSVWLWAQRLWGPRASLPALALCVLCPSLLAHGPLVTNDLTVTTFLFSTHLLAWRAVRRLSAWRVAAAGMALGLALLAKYSALFAVPVLALAFAAVALTSTAMTCVHPLSRATLSLTDRWPRLLGAATAWIGMILVAGGVVWAFHGFRFHPWGADDPRRGERQRRIAEVRQEALLESRAQQAVLDAADAMALLPETYLLGARYTLKHMEHRLAFFEGERTIHGNPWYFPTAFALKSPPSLLLLLLLCAALALCGRLRVPEGAGPFLLLFPLLYFAYSLTARINIGQRYLLPVYPFLFVLCGGAASVLLGSRRRAARAAALAILAGSAWSTLAIHPDYLAYFNFIAGGPRGGIRYLGDSNLDWGQDLKGVGPWMQAHGVPRIKLAYFGTALPEYYGFAFDWMPSVGFLNEGKGSLAVQRGDYLAVSATCLQGFYFDDMSQYRFLERFEPVDVIGGTIYVYHLVPDRLRGQPAR